MSGAGAPSRSSSTERPGAERPSLRLVDCRRGGPSAENRERPDGHATLHGFADRVLVAGADPAERARMLAELRSLLPTDTDFREAGETWEVIAQACDSRLVVLAGDLGDTSASALLRLLARRNPELPVLAVGADRRARPTSAPVGEPGDGRYRPAADAAHA